MKAIVAVDKNWGIGRGKKLLVHLPGDLNYFKEKTLGKIVVMGRETLESLPGKRPLPGRRNIVLTRNRGYGTECPLCHSKQELLDLIMGENDEDVFIIGGEKVYRDFLPSCDTCYVTKIDESYDADKFFPNLDEDDDFSLIGESPTYEENGTRYKFVEYRRKRQQLDSWKKSSDGSVEE